MILGTLANGKKIAVTSGTGPTSYAAGGFTTYAPLNKIDTAIVSVKTWPKADNLVYKLEYTVSGNATTIKAYKLDVTASAPASWAEATGDDLSSLAFDLIVIGY